MLAGRDLDRLESVASNVDRCEVRVASIDDPDVLGRALDGADAVINAAGPFAVTAEPLIRAALVAGVPYLDVAAEPDVVESIVDLFRTPAVAAGVSVMPTLGFYRSLGNLAGGQPLLMP